MHNAGIQNRLFHEIDKLLHCKSGHACHDWENAMADAVGEIFHDNKDISAHIKAHHIKIMVDHLAARGTKITTIMHALRYENPFELLLAHGIQMFDNFSCTTKIPSLNLRLKHNQQLIMKYIMTHREEIIDRAFNQVKYGFEPTNPLGVSTNVDLYGLAILCYDCSSKLKFHVIKFFDRLTTTCVNFTSSWFRCWLPVPRERTDISSHFAKA